MYEYLDKINSPDELKALPEEEIPFLIEDLRTFLIDKVEKQGGHLASNLGVVELSVALHRNFNSPKDKIIFDVGHQSYVHKILTGRKNEFDSLRIPGGLSGFTTRREGAHDPFGAGHSSTSISAALGCAEADKLRGSDNFTVAVIGDGAYTGGMVHEAINNCQRDLRLIVVINENGMSISSNKGAFASYLSGVRASRGYRDVKRGVASFLTHIPLVGVHFKGLLSLFKRLLLRFLFIPNYLEDLGFYYIGPIDGNDYKKVDRALKEARDIGGTCFVHLITKKGKGYKDAEQAPEKYHSISTGATPLDTFHSVFAEELIKQAENDNSICAVTAGMGVGTGLCEFEKAFADRYFDVGIAEQHALTFSAGLAASGIKPYTAIYSTFLQRGYDSIVHDIALQTLPVRIFIDRAGLSKYDGATHHGIFDVSFMSHIPGVELYAPATFDSLRLAVIKSLDAKGPFAVRYANTCESPLIKEHNWQGEDLLVKYDFDLEAVPKNIFITYGNICEKVILAEKRLKKQGCDVGIILVECIKPYFTAASFIADIAKSGTHFVYVEEGIKNGGAAMITEQALRESGIQGVAFDIAAIEDSFVIPDTVCDIYDYAGLSEDKLIKYFIQENK